MQHTASTEPPNAATPALDPQEQRARDFLAAGKFRKARDEFKILCKRDRSRYLPFLVQANLGLAREMLGKGMVSEAEQVLGYLRTIAGSAEICLLENEIARATGDWKKCASGSLILLETEEALPEAERIRLVDGLVLAFEASDSDASSGKLATEVQAVQAALQAVCAEQFDQALDRLRPIPHGSPCSHWKFFVKALVAFYRGEREKARKLFAALPSPSVPARGAKVWALLGGNRPSSGLSEPDFGAACQLMGLKGLRRSLLDADRLWRARDYVSSYQIIRQALPQFPQMGPDSAGVLGEFFFNGLSRLPGEAFYAYTGWFESLETKAKSRNTLERMLALRALCLTHRDMVSPEMLEEKWEEYLAMLRERLGEHPKRDSLGYAWLGEVMATSEMSSEPGYWRREADSLVDAECAIRALEKSIALDPAHLSAHLKLADVFEQLKRTSERNRLLDVMTERFPDDEKVLLCAGRLCLERRAFVKGLDYLERAAAQDHLDPAIPQAIVETLTQMVLQHYQKQRIDLTQATWQRIETFILDKEDDFVRNRWTVWARRGLVEKLFGDAKEAETFLTQSRDLSPAPVVFLFFVHLAQRAYAQKTAPLWARELETLRPSEIRATHVPTLFRILRHWEPQLRHIDKIDEERRVKSWFRTAADQPFTREEAVDVFDTIGHDEPDCDLELFIEPLLKEDPTDPMIRIHSLKIKEARYGKATDEECLEAEDIAREASRRGEEKAARLAREFLDRAKQPSSEPELFFGPEPWDLEDDEEDYPEIPVNLELSMLFPGMSEKELAEMEKVLDLLATIPEHQISNFRKARPKGISGEQFDQLLLMAQARGAVDSGPVPPPNKPKYKPAPRFDDRQQELF